MVDEVQGHCLFKTAKFIEVCDPLNTPFKKMDWVCHVAFLMMTKEI